MVEWHSIGEYRVSFDVRPDASRFILLGQPEVEPNLLAQGLIFESIRGVEVLCDDKAWSMPTAVEQEIARLWSNMRGRLSSRASP